MSYNFYFQTKEISSLKKDIKLPDQSPNNNSNQDMEIQMTTDASTLRLTPPTSIPGLKPVHQHRYNVLGPPNTTEKNVSQISTPSSEESNSPTEMNSYKKMQEKPPLIKKILGLTVNNTNNDDDSCPLVSDSTPNSTPGKKGLLISNTNKSYLVLLWVLI